MGKAGGTNVRQVTRQDGVTARSSRVGLGKYFHFRLNIDIPALNIGHYDIIPKLVQDEGRTLS